MAIGLRIDVDTFRGTRDGVPRLREILNRRHIAATWYFTVGPDNMGRHIWRMARPAFAMKMLRTRAASIYGPEILFRGTFWPGPRIGRKLGQVIADAINDGHELGLHAWDHHRWQAGIERLPIEELRAEIDRAWNEISDITGRAPITSASPGWRCTDAVLAMKSDLPFEYNSDCRGAAQPFLPVVEGKVLLQPQAPVDLPTYDEAVGRDGVDDVGWNELLLKHLSDGRPHVLTIHAESEGGAKGKLFEDFLDRALAAGHEFLPLGKWLKLQIGPGGVESLPKGHLIQGEIPGREGWLAVAELNSK